MTTKTIYHKYKYCLTIIFLALLSGCTTENKVDDSMIFRLNRYDNISSLDPIQARTQANNWACNLLYNSLVKIDYNLNIQPDIAKNWSISEDGKTYTFLLRDDVFFHRHPAFGKDSTRAVIASDFTFSFDRLKDPKNNGSGGWIMSNIESYKALNDSVFQIQLKEAFPPFLGLISMKYASVVPKELFTDGENSFTQNPIGTGPFQFKIWVDNVKMVLRKNPLYFEYDDKNKRLPYLDAVNITFLPEKNSEFLELIKGNLDMMADLDPSYKDEILSANGELNSKYSHQIRLIKEPYLSTVYFSFYLDDGKEIDKRLRQAMNYGIDKQKIIRYLMKGQGFAADGGFIPKGLAGHSAKNGYPYDPKKAKSLIDSYRKEYPNGTTIELTTVQEYVDVCEYFAAEMAKIGLKINVNVVPGPTMREGKSTGKFAFFRANWGADYADAENFLSLFYSKNFAPEGPNYSHFRSPEFDQLYYQSFLENNADKRAKIYERLDYIMMQEAPIVPLFYDQTALFTNKKVKNLRMSPIKLLDLTRVYKEK
ncbi:ABC transporter substrate-binding protein [Weeksella virosa]|uniref:ABC transporter substrate-binding protein n=1 Tax=Weeksella virosa TaxID=1014 RepID=UPI002556F09F|nr:ABC transporter substrate-binding protein [Weeksella virosa]MDK7674647.1 ABC transporter substrate-binding protein [Weeksella virosa]